jgi:RpiR family transcriptional regulator, glv operon transcriptional regulator
MAILFYNSVYIRVWEDYKMWLDKRIITCRGNLTKNDLDILDEIKQLSYKMPTLGIIELAEILHTSKSSISRLTQKLGFKGYSEFKYHFSLNESETIQFETQDLRELMKRDINDTIKLAESTNFVPLINHIKNSSIIYCYGTGTSQKKALEEFSRLMITLDKRVIVIPVFAELLMTVGTLTENDMLIICSLRGNTPEVKEVVTKIKGFEIPLVGISKFSQNYLGENSNLSYYYYSSPFFDNNKNKERTTLIGLNVLLEWIYRECFIEYLSKSVEKI